MDSFNLSITTWMNDAGVPIPANFPNDWLRYFLNKTFEDPVYSMLAGKVETSNLYDKTETHMDKIRNCFNEFHEIYSK